MVFHHRALTSPVTRFVTINPSCYTLRDALTNKRGDSRPKMGFLTLRVSFPLFPPLSFLLFVLLLVPLNLFYLVHFNTDFLSMLFLSSYNLIFIHPGYSQDDVNGWIRISLHRTTTSVQPSPFFVFWEMATISAKMPMQWIGARDVRDVAIRVVGIGEVEKNRKKEKNCTEKHEWDRWRLPHVASNCS